MQASVAAARFWGNFWKVPPLLRCHRGSRNVVGSAVGPLPLRLVGGPSAPPGPACGAPQLGGVLGLRSLLPPLARFGGRAVVGRYAPSFEMGMGGQGPPRRKAPPPGGY